MAAPQATELFAPLQKDEGVNLLKKFFGCVVDQLGGGAGGSCSASENAITTIVSFVNVGIIVMALLVGIYLAIKFTLDTASDGDIAGASGSGAGTAVRVLIGAILFIPSGAGFSLGQIFGLWIAVQASYFGDNLWSRLSDLVVNDVTVATSEATAGGTDVVRASVGKVLQQSTLAALCKLEAEKIGTTTGAQTSISGSVTAVNTVDGSGWMLSYQDSSKGLFSATVLCGYSKVVLSTIPQISASDPNSQSLQNFGRRLAEQARTVNLSAWKAGLEAARTEGANIAQKITTDKNSASINQAIQTAVNTITGNIISDVQTGIMSDDALIQAQKQTVANLKDKGWIYAGAFEGSMVSLTDTMSAVKTPVTATAELTNDLSGYYPWIWQDPLSAGLKGQVEADMAYFDTLSKSFIKAGNGDVVAPGQEDNSDKADKFFAEASGIFTTWISTFADTGASAKYVDPFAKLQALGSRLFGAGTLLAVGGGLLSIITGIGEAVGSFGMYVLILGIVLAGILPLVPLTYFFFAVLGWAISVVEAVFVLPIWAMTFFIPSRDPGYIGEHARWGVMMLGGMLLRPAFIVVGLLLCYLAARYGLALWVGLFNMGYGGRPPSMSSFSSLPSFLGALTVFTLGSVVLVVMCSGLISSLPDYVISKIDGAAQNAFGRQAAEHVSGSVGAGGRVAQGVDAVGAAGHRISASSGRGIGQGIKALKGRSSQPPTGGEK